MRVGPIRSVQIRNPCQTRTFQLLMTPRKRKMSAPNKNYDPVEVTALTADEVDRATQAALTAIAAAQTLDELKEARLAHAGDKAPLSLAPPPASRAAAAP